MSDNQKRKKITRRQAAAKAAIEALASNGISSSSNPPNSKTCSPCMGDIETYDLSNNEKSMSSILASLSYNDLQPSTPTKQLLIK
jgi:hypothetical protein